MSSGNVLYLGIAASYFAIAIIQWRVPDLLPASLYVSVAFVSLNLTIMELIKTIFQYMKAIHVRQIELTQDELTLCSKHIEVLSKFAQLKGETDKYAEYLSSLEITKKKLHEDKTIQRFERVISSLSDFQVVFSCIIVAMTSLKIIPNDLASNKLIGVLSLTSFAFFAFSFYMRNKCEMTLNMPEITSKNANSLKNYYLDMIKRITPDENDNGHY